MRLYFEKISQFLKMKLIFTTFILVNLISAKCSCRNKRSQELVDIEEDDPMGSIIGENHNHGHNMQNDIDIDEIDSVLEDLKQKHTNGGIFKNHGHRMPRYTVGHYKNC